MTTDDFKKQYPHLAHLEGDMLWNAMEDSVLRAQKVRYRLRYLFIFVVPNFVMQVGNWKSPTVCAKCKGGVGTKCGIAFMGKFTWFCNHCSSDLEEVANTSLRYILYKKCQVPAVKLWRAVLTFLHIAKWDTSGRYDLFGEESNYARWSFNTETGESRTILKPRKWWEYIVIRKR